ncbi:MAG: hypothetical protein QG595_65 [Pseudomonadota bacterium]|jgi:stalled ribosome rescue protein Dom34|nr:hypothetical protein [Chromatiales bacterium]MDQ1302082.1 hypothetical protein [Pseudomonadota bacterium]
MIRSHAIVWLDHQHAQVLHFDDEKVLSAKKLKAHTIPTKQHGSKVRTEHEFFGEVCDALEGIPEVLAVGPHTAAADFEHYAKKHRPQTAKHIAAYQVVDHPSENQLVALGREFFLKYDRMGGKPGSH